MNKPFQHLLILDIDGLRYDVYLRALLAGKIPRIATLLGRRPGVTDELDLCAWAPIPSITFTCQASIFTGATPAQHGIAGSVFFDRFGRASGGKPRPYYFDAHRLAGVDETILTYASKAGLANKVLSTDVRTLYEVAAEAGLTSTVVYNMISRGCTHWVRPRISDMARFARGGKVFGLEREKFEIGMVHRALRHVRKHGLPSILTLYFLGIDHISHKVGTHAQEEYLVKRLDPMVGPVLEELDKSGRLDRTLVVVLSDHGQVQRRRHAFRARLNLDVILRNAIRKLSKASPFPGLAAFAASNGGMAQIYVRDSKHPWREPAPFEAGVVPVLDSLVQGSKTGDLGKRFRSFLSVVASRNVEKEGWHAPFRPMELPKRSLSPMERVIFERRLTDLTGPSAGDILLFSDYEHGAHFGPPSDKGLHGSYVGEDGMAVLAFGTPAPDEEAHSSLRGIVSSYYEDLVLRDARPPFLTDFVPLARRMLGL